MEKKELAEFYGFGELPEELDAESITVKYDEAYVKAAAEHTAERLGEKRFYLFASCDIGPYSERQLKFADYLEEKYGIRGSLVFEPVLCVSHYMNRRGIFRIEREDLLPVIKAMTELPYHFYGIISEKDPEKEKMDALVNRTRGMALVPAIVRQCLVTVTDSGAEFVHASKNSREVSLNFFRRKA